MPKREGNWSSCGASEIGVTSLWASSPKIRRLRLVNRFNNTKTQRHRDTKKPRSKESLSAVSLCPCVFVFSYSIKLKTVFQRELDDTRVHAGGRDLSEVARPHVGKGICAPSSVVRITELRMVEGVEEFGAELDRMILQDLDPFQNRDVPVELAGALNNTDTRIAVVRSVSDNGRRAKGGFVEVARAAACAT